MQTFKFLPAFAEEENISYRTGPGTTLFGAYESVFSVAKNPRTLCTTIQSVAYGIFFQKCEGSSCNSGSATVDMGKNIFLGVSMSDLSTSNTEIKKVSIYDSGEIISVNT